MWSACSATWPPGASYRPPPTRRGRVGRAALFAPCAVTPGITAPCAACSYGARNRAAVQLRGGGRRVAGGRGIPSNQGDQVVETERLGEDGVGSEQARRVRRVARRAHRDDRRLRRVASAIL